MRQLESQGPARAGVLRYSSNASRVWSVSSRTLFEIITLRTRRAYPLIAYSRKVDGE